jgi:3-dehydroquinate synthase
MPCTEQNEYASHVHELRVELAERSYPILIGAGLCDEFARHFQNRCANNRHAIIVYDQQIAALAQSIGRQLEGSDRRVSLIDVPSGEQSKSVDSLQSLWQRMLHERTDRGSVVVAVGGGVIGDLAGFAAASYARGIPLVQVPTTLLSQVDSSVGGKTGINLPAAKNIVGAFWQPSLVVIDTQTLQTLPDREYISGLAEVVKYGVILLPELFEFLEQNAEQVLERKPQALAYIVRQSCLAKAQVVQEDERETGGRRAILNYGHTFAHAIEATAGYGRWLHGEAVAMGMHMAAHLARLLGRVDEAWVGRQAQLLKRLRLPWLLPDADEPTLWAAMQHDKKVMHAALRFVLPIGNLGKVELVSGISQQQVYQAIRSASQEH